VNDQPGLISVVHATVDHVFCLGTV